MSGFENDVVYAKNADFTQADNQAASEANGLFTNGQLWIGSTVLNAGSTHINVGVLTSPDSSITFGYSSPNITAVVSGGATVGKTITGDSGGALSPTAGNWNIFGLSGSKTSGSGSTLTVKSPPYVQAGASATSSLNTGEFVTGAFTRTLPASAGLADGDLIEYVCTSAAAMVIQAVGAQTIRIGNVVSSAAGTATSSGLAGDSVSLRFNATTGTWFATSVIGVWVLA